MNGPRSVSASLLGSRFIRFLLAGGLAALVNFGSRFFYNLFVDFSTAVVLAFFTGLITGYILNKRYVFTSSGNSMVQEIGWFVFVNLIRPGTNLGLECVPGAGIASLHACGGR